MYTTNETNIHALEFQTCNSSSQAAANLCNRLHGQWDHSTLHEILQKQSTLVKLNIFPLLYQSSQTSAENTNN